MPYRARVEAPAARRRAHPPRHQAPPAVRLGADGRARAALRAPARRPGPPADAGRLPGRVRQVDAARRLARDRARSAAGRVGDAGRGRQRPGRAVDARDRGARACPSPSRRCRAAPLREVVLPRLVNALAEQRRGRARARRLPPPLERVDARERRVVRRPPAGERPARALDPHRPRAPARHAAGARAAARAARRRAALHAPTRRTSSSTSGSSLELDDERRRAARRPHRGLARRHLPRRAVAGGHARTSTRS